MERGRDRQKERSQGSEAVSDTNSINIDFLVFRIECGSDQPFAKLFSPLS